MPLYMHRNFVKKYCAIRHYSARLREISTSGLTKKRSQPQQNRASSGVRLAKKLARTKILKIQSPRSVCKFAIRLKKSDFNL